MLTFESYSPIRVRDKKESAIWITLLVVMSVLLCLAIILATWFSAGGLFGPVEGGAWWAYGETMSATAWDGAAELAGLTAGKQIMVIETDSTGKDLKAGVAEITTKTE